MMLISRRRVLAGVAGATALAPRWAFADRSCALAGDQSTQLCTVGLQVGEIETARQRCNLWCWAACIETVFAFHGRVVPQETVVERLFGDPTTCQSATDDQIIAIVDGSWTDQSGATFNARAERLPFAPMGIAIVGSEVDLTDAAAIAAVMTSNLFANDDLKMLIGELENNNPLIVGIAGDPVGHATVLSAVSYVEGSSGTVALTELVVRDPAPGSENRHVLTTDEVRNLFFVARVTVED